MNYSRSIKKKSMGERVLLMMAVVGIAFFLVGFAAGNLAHKAPEPMQEPTQEAPQEEEQEVLIYGQYDGRIFEGEMSMDWGAGDMDFVPLDVPLDEDLQEFIFYLSAGYNIDFTLVMAVIQCESSYRADVISETGDYGLMQINKMNHEYLSETLGITDFLEPYQNIRGGLFVLRKLFEKYQTPEKVLMAYNMGENAASRLWEQGIFETNYSKNVFKVQAELLEQKGDQND